MPRPVTRKRILSAGAGATAVVAALSFALSPPADVDPLGALGRANANAPTPAPAGPPAAFGVEGIDLASLGYSGPDLAATSLVELSAPFSELPTVRAADVRDRLNAAAPHLRGLHQAKILLRKAAEKQDHHLYAAKVAAGQSSEALTLAQQRLDEALAAAAAVPAPEAPAAEPGDPGPAVELVDVGHEADAPVIAEAQGRGSDEVVREGAEAPADGPAVEVPASPAAGDPQELVRQGLLIERLAAELAEARAAADRQWTELEARRERHRALHEAAAVAEKQTERFDKHVRWLGEVLRGAQSQMPSTGAWLVDEERGTEDLPIVEVRGFEVHESLEDSVRQLVDAAAAAGIDLEGTGYRSITRQIELRREHCGSSQYDIFEKPSSQCSPPTAKPGRSIHELGLALDLRNGENSIVSRRDPAFRWLAQNAPSYGLYNLPAEPWHWSVTGQ